MNNALNITPKVRQNKRLSTQEPNIVSYSPQPIDTSGQAVPSPMLRLIEQLAQNTHDHWARQRFLDGWEYGPKRDDDLKQNPCLVPYEELPEEEKDYDRKITTELVLAILAKGFRIEPNEPANVTVEWWDRKRADIRSTELCSRLSDELKMVFSSCGDVRVFVRDVLSGYTRNESEKIVLGVQVDGDEHSTSHIVKLGNRKSVAADYEGWQECIARRGTSSRILSSVSGFQLPNDRFAVVYQDAYRGFDGNEAGQKGLLTLEHAVNDSIFHNDPSIDSIERSLKELYGELNRCLYRHASEDTGSAKSFYSTELQKPSKSGDQHSAWERWDSDDFFRTIRRDAIWLFTGSMRPDSTADPTYLDPFDYLSWAFQNDRVPQTLAGSAHGDLHGRNILIGSMRGEAQQPVVFDFGDMSAASLPVWDFVKLEMELKTRLLPILAYDEAACSALQKYMAEGNGASDSPAPVEPSRRIRQLTFAHSFELLLGRLTAEVVSRNAADLSRTNREIVGQQSIDGALCLLLRIRQEAAYYLGYTIGRSQQWRDEYGFALAIYGLLKAKWDSDEPELECALVSSGVAIASMTSAKQAVREAKAKPTPKAFPATGTPSHLIPLAWGHTCWMNKQSDDGCRILDQAIKEYPTAVPLRSEYALCLAQQDRYREAIEQVEAISGLCVEFKDYETLCRLARVYKDLGDRRLATDLKQQYGDFDGMADTEFHVARQLYVDAMRLYEQAYAISQNYYPGINAATLALLVGQEETVNRYLQQLEHYFRVNEIPSFREQLWWFATQGEAALLSKTNSAKALQCYSQAFDCPNGTDPGVVQSLYNQLCRLAWPLGCEAVEPIVREMKRRDLLDGIDSRPLGVELNIDF